MPSTGGMYYEASNQETGIYKEGITDIKKNGNDSGNSRHYLYVINKEGEVASSVEKGNDVNVNLIDATQLGIKGGNVPWTIYPVEKASEDEYIIALPEELPTYNDVVYDKVVIGIMTSDPDATFEYSDTNDVVGDPFWIYQAVKITDNDGNVKDSVKFKVKAADGITSKEYTIRFTHASSDASITDIEFQDSVLKDYTTKEVVPFSSDKYVYLLQTDKTSVSASITKSEGSSVYVDDVLIESDTSNYTIKLS